MTVRLLCISAPSYAIQVPPGVPASGARFYGGPGAAIAAGDVVDVPGDATGDAAALVNTGFFVMLGQSGTTSQRPTYPKAGSQFVDTTLSKMVTFTGTDWRDVTGASV